MMDFSDLIYDFLITLSKRLTEIDVSTILTTLQCKTSQNFANGSFPKLFSNSADGLDSFFKPIFKFNRFYCLT